MPNSGCTGIVVRNAIGKTNVNIVLRREGKEETGYLPATRIDLSTSLAFHVLTNQILVVANRNQRL